MSTAGTVVILAAGQGTRMRSPRPKVLHGICGRPMLGWVLDQAFALEPSRVIVVIGHGADEVRAWVEGSARPSSEPTPDGSSCSTATCRS